jgi:AcrR family transcriptional regulator
MPRKSTSKPAIIGAAIELIASEGAMGVRIDGVAASAGVNKRMIYHHFDDREGLLKAVFAHLTAIAKDRGWSVVWFEHAFGSLKITQDSSALADDVLMRILLAEYLRKPRAHTDQVLQSLRVQAKPVFRLASTTRFSNRALEKP